MKVLDALHIQPSNNELLRSLKLIPANDGRKDIYQLEFEDINGRLVQSASEFILKSKSDPSKQKVLSSWPFELTKEDLKEFDQIEFNLLILPSRSFKLDISELSASPSTKHSLVFKFDWHLSYDSSRLVRV